MNLILRSATLLSLTCLLFAGCSDESTTAVPIVFAPPDSITSSMSFEDAAEVLFTQDGTGIIVGHASEGWGTVVATMYDRATGAEIRTFNPNPSRIYGFESMALSSDGKTLVAAIRTTGSISGGNAYPGFAVWDVATGRLRNDPVNLPTSNLPSPMIFVPGDSVLAERVNDFWTVSQLIYSIKLGHVHGVMRGVDPDRRG